MDEDSLILLRDAVVRLVMDCRDADLLDLIIKLLCKLVT